MYLKLGEAAHLTSSLQRTACGFLEHLLPEDMVMADRGFTITECWPKASNIGYSGIHQRKISTRPN